MRASKLGGGKEPPICRKPGCLSQPLSMLRQTCVVGNPLKMGVSSPLLPALPGGIQSGSGHVLWERHRTPHQSTRQGEEITPPPSDQICHPLSGCRLALLGTWVSPLGHMRTLCYYVIDFPPSLSLALIISVCPEQLFWQVLCS